MVERKWCVSCQALREASGFKLVKKNNISRWKCSVCLNREAQPKYKGKTSE